MRAPFQILAIPYRKKQEYQFCVFHRADIDQYQFVAGGGEDVEKPSDAAVREIWEETGIVAASVIPLTSMAYIPASVISEKHRKSWAKDTFVIPEYAFGFECSADIILSSVASGLPQRMFSATVPANSTFFCSTMATFFLRTVRSISLTSTPPTYTLP